MANHNFPILFKVPTFSLLIGLLGLNGTASASIELHINQPGSTNFAGNSSCKTALLKRLDNIINSRQSHCTLKVAMYSFNDKGLLGKLRAIKRLGNSVEVILDKGQSSSSYSIKEQDLTGSQIPVGILGKEYTQRDSGSAFHHKFTLFSCPTNSNNNNLQATHREVMMGSYNWTTAANTRNYEDCLFIKDENVFNQLDAQFDRLNPNYTPPVSSSHRGDNLTHTGESGYNTNPDTIRDKGTSLFHSAKIPSGESNTFSNYNNKGTPYPQPTAIYNNPFSQPSKLAKEDNNPRALKKGRTIPQDEALSSHAMLMPVPQGMPQRKVPSSQPIEHEILAPDSDAEEGESNTFSNYNNKGTPYPQPTAIYNNPFSQPSKLAKEDNNPRALKKGRTIPQDEALSSHAMLMPVPQGMPQRKVPSSQQREHAIIVHDSDSEEENNSE